MSEMSEPMWLTEAEQNSIRWYFNAHAERPDQGYATAGIHQVENILNAHLCRFYDLADDLTRDGDRATERRSYSEGVAKRYSANLIRAALNRADA